MSANLKKIRYLKIIAPLAVVVIFAAHTVIAQNDSSAPQYANHLSAPSSEQAASTIYTCPGPDCSTTMNISWNTAPGRKCKIELVDLSNYQTYIYDYEDGSEVVGTPISNSQIVEIDTLNAPGADFRSPMRCRTFDGINSRLANGHDVVEHHVIDKHGYELFDLKPDTEYAYRIITYNDSTGRDEYSATHHFHTAGAKAWKAAVIGDFHHYSPMPGRLRAAMGMVDTLDSIAGGCDWVLSTGDQNAWGASLNFWTEISEQPQFVNKMWASVQGNHDHESRDREKSDAFFRDSHFFPWNGYAGQEGVTYWFRYGDVLFLMLNTEATGHEDFEKASEWLEKVITENPSKYVVVVEHKPWLLGQNGANAHLDRWRETFDRLGVDLAIAGDNHVYMRTYPLRDRQPVDPAHGTYYVVNSSSDNNRGREMKPLKANHDLIAKRWTEGSHTVGAMLMDVNPSRIQMTLYDRYGTAQDTFTVPAKR